ncbi:archaeosortase/exosortase family protein [Puniceicoccaceae bacterium K14]|nr:archaeosortase/exosortase family protein [Puniceicoccaceae bacterium K14]
METKSTFASTETRAFIVSVFLVSIGFFVPLEELYFFASNSNLYSHTIIIPFASIVFIFLEEKDTPLKPALPSWSGIIPLGLGVCLLYLFLTGGYSTEPQFVEDYLAISVGAFVFLVIAAALFTLDTKTASKHSFSLIFLFFMIPMPIAMRQWVEEALQYASADAAEMIFALSSTPLYRDGLIFNLPGLALEVAPQCSGIHSSLVLFIVSIAATKLFLKSWWKRILLVGFIIPLAVIRNGFRVFVLGELAVRYDPAILHSWLHKKGGPIFFALSLIPLFILLFVLYRSEYKKKLQP